MCKLRSFHPLASLSVLLALCAALLLCAHGARADDSGSATPGVDNDGIPAPAFSTAPGEDGSYGDFYSPDELAALDAALWSGNMTRADLHFKKDYAKGYECFPIVRQMMADPLAIGPYLSSLAQAAGASQGQALSDGIANAAREELEAGKAPSGTNMWDVPQEGLDFSQYLPHGGTAAENKLLLDCAQILALPGVGGPETAHTEAFREWLPTAMAWHAVDSSDTKAASDAENAPSKDMFALASQLDWLEPGLWDEEVCSKFAAGLPALDKSAFPTDKPYIMDTPVGRIVLGTLKDDTYSGDYAMLIDPGGNDHYLNCRIGAAYGKRTHGVRLGWDGGATGMSADWSPLGNGRIAFFADLGGDDYYDCGNTDITLGAAVLGCAAFYDLGQGNDRYSGGNCCLGAACGGLATFYDDGGSDSYSGKAYCEGAAGFGLAVMCDESLQAAPVIPTDVETPDPIQLALWDNDSYDAWTEAQGFARTDGFAICYNRRGNETYHAGGVYLDAPLFTDRFQSFSQGFAIGERDIDYGGGIALIVDDAGNDRYLGDIYNQGVGYWYSAGFLYDKSGNDLYEMTQYGQGSGIHLAIGGLIDETGTDTYLMNNGLGQGGSHDFAAGLLLDREGNDRYLGNTSCDGCGLTNSVGLFIDDAGDDVYAGKKDGGVNFGRPARGFGSIGLLLDLGGSDSYLAQMQDDMLWSQTETGMGVDIGPTTSEQIASLYELGSGLFMEDNVMPGQGPTAKNNAGFDKPSEGLKMPDEISYQGELDQAIFDKLWEIAIRWEVGDNRAIVPEARKRLEAFGPAVLPYIEKKMDDPNSLAVRGYVDIFKFFAYEPEPTPDPSAPVPATPPAPVPPEAKDTLHLVQELLTRQLASGDTQREMSSMAVITELKLPGMGQGLLPVLDSPDAGMQRRAIATLGAIAEPIANDRLLANLDPNTPDEALIKASLEALCGMKVDCYGRLRNLLGFPSITVREALANQLVANWDAYKVMVVSDFHNPAGLDARAQRTLLRVLARVDQKPTAGMIGDLNQYLGSKDWGVRQDFLALARKWNSAVEDDPKLSPLFAGNTGLMREISGMLETTKAPVPEHFEEIKP